jgi:hypothetical protein
MSEMVSHKRRVYGWLDLLGDLGGVTEVVMIVFGFVLFTISEHSFYIKAISTLFLARTEDKELFINKNNLKLEKYSKYQPKEVELEGI